MTEFERRPDSGKPKENHNFGLSQDKINQLWLYTHPEFRKEVSNEAYDQINAELIESVVKQNAGEAQDLRMEQSGFERYTVSYGPEGERTKCVCSIEPPQDYGFEKMQFTLRTHMIMCDGQYVEQPDSSQALVVIADSAFVKEKKQWIEDEYAKEAQEAERRSEQLYEAMRTVIVPKIDLLKAEGWADWSSEALSALAPDELERLFGDTLSENQLATAFIRIAADFEPSVYTDSFTKEKITDSTPRFTISAYVDGNVHNQLHTSLAL